MRTGQSNKVEEGGLLEKRTVSARKGGGGEYEEGASHCMKMS